MSGKYVNVNVPYDARVRHHKALFMADNNTYDIIVNNRSQALVSIYSKFHNSELCLWLIISCGGLADFRNKNEIFKMKIYIVNQKKTQLSLIA